MLDGVNLIQKYGASSLVRRCANVLYRGTGWRIFCYRYQMEHGITPEVVHHSIAAILGSENDVQEVIDTYTAAG
jgi:hypothetical protein